MSLTLLTNANVINDGKYLPENFQYITERLSDVLIEIERRMKSKNVENINLCGKCSIVIYYNLAGASYMSGIWIKINGLSKDIWLFSPFIKSLKLKVFSHTHFENLTLRKGYGMPPTFYKKPTYIFDYEKYKTISNLIDGICEKIKILCGK